MAAWRSFALLARATMDTSDLIFIMFFLNVIGLLMTAMFAAR